MSILYSVATAHFHTALRLAPMQGLACFPFKGTGQCRNSRAAGGAIGGAGGVKGSEHKVSALVGGRDGGDECYYYN